MAHDITIEALAEALNQRFVSIAPKVETVMRVGLEFESRLTFVPTDGIFMTKNASIGNILQPYQPGFTPNNAETWDSVENEIEFGKADLEFTAEQLEEAWDTLLANYFELDTSPDMWTYVNHVLNTLVLPKLMEEINDATYNGVRVDPTPGTPGTYLQAWDGFGKKIADAITGGELTTVPTGALAANTIEDQVRAFCAGLPKAYRFKKGKIFMASTRAVQYAEAFQDKYNYSNEVRDNLDRAIYRVNFYNKEVVPMMCMEGSDRFIFSPDMTDNMIIGQRKRNGVVEAKYPRFRFQVIDRKLKLLSEMSRFYGFRAWFHQFVNDQA